MKLTTLEAIGRAIEGLGYAPVLPVDAQEFADAGRRREWISTRNMQVFSLVSENHRETTIDLFVSEPFDGDVGGRAACPDPSCARGHRARAP